MSRRTAHALAITALGALVALLLGAGAPAGRAESNGGVPLIGANYSHFAWQNCSGDGAGIIAGYNIPGVRRRVRAQLAAMRAAGIETLRLLVWHMTDAAGQPWGVVSSAGGRLAEPNRSNLIRYVRDVRQTGFARLTVSLGPNWTNSPFGQPQYVYDPAKFEENWAFLRDLRALAKAHGPGSALIDLIHEAPPSDYTPPRAAAGPARLSR